MPNSPALRFALWLLLVLLIVWVGSQVDFVFAPFILIGRSLFWPIVLAGLFYYWFSPVVGWLVARRLSRSLSILLVYAAVATGLAFILAWLLPSLREQLMHLIGNAPRLVGILRARLLQLEDNEWVVRLFEYSALTLEDLVNQLVGAVNNALQSVGQHIAPLIGITTNVLSMMFIVPFLLFYMLRDGHKLPDVLVSWLPLSQRPEAKKLIADMDKALSNYIQGQALVSVTVGIMAFFGYLIIGLNYALVLAIAATVTNIVPYVGPILGTIPALIVGLIAGPATAWRVLVVMVLVQQIESLVISPRIMSKKIHSHPVSIILVMLAAGRLAGLVGILFAIPAYAVLRVVVSYSYMLVRLFREQPSRRD